MEGLQYLLEKDLILQAVQGKYHLTNNGAALIKVGHKCSRLGPITSWIREVGAISDLSTFEMFLLLLQKGWVLVDAETKTKCQPFRMNAEKNFYITGGAMGRSYFIVLLRHEELLGEHLPKIFHMQPVAYYDAILACAAAGQRSLLSRIVPHQPASFYKSIASDSRQASQAGLRKGRKRLVDKPLRRSAVDFEDEPGLRPAYTIL